MTIADLNTLTRFLCDADTTSYTAANLLINMNDAYQTVHGWVQGIEGTYNADDTNYTDAPRGDFNLVDGQEDYSFNPQTAGPYVSHFLDIEAVEVKNKASPAMYIRLKPIDHQELGDMSPQEYFGLESNGSPRKGLPEFYDKSGNTIRLYPAPDTDDVTLTEGLRIWFKRNADLYTAAQVTTGTKEPGFAAQFHTILAYMAARPYCGIYKKDRMPFLNSVVGDLTPIPTGMKKELLKFYGHREADKRKVMTMKSINYF